MKLFLLLILIIDATLSQISYPEKFEIKKTKANLEGRLPVYSPSKCKSYELLYPGDQLDDWICDCEPAAVYYPESDACFPVFRQGPCAKDKFLVLGVNKIIPECIKNDCKEDGKVLINNKCYKLGESGPCPLPELSYVIGVNETTLKLDCVRLSVAVNTRFADDLITTTTQSTTIKHFDPCARGSKRAIQGRCLDK